MKRQRGTISLQLIIYLAIAAAVLGAIYGSYRWVDSSWETSAGIKRGASDKQAEWDKAVADQRERERLAAETASTKLETGNEKARVVYKTITRAVDRYVDRPVYRRECFDADGLRDANRAILGQEGEPPGKPDRAVPRPDAAAGRERGLSPAEGR